jgi:hypothetical protein
VRFVQVFTIAGLALGCGLAPAQAEKRVVLVVGNGRYANLAANDS